MTTKYDENPEWQSGKDIMNIDVHESWDRILKSDKIKGLMTTLATQFDKELEVFGDHKPIFPKLPDIYNAFRYCPLNELRVVIIGQDAYHNPGEAHGLCFSVPKGKKVPPSLKNVYKALEHDPKVNFKRPDHGCLEEWAKQGILMMNCGLTVRQNKASSHLKYWTPITDEIIRQIAQTQDRVIFVLWGVFAKKKGEIVREFDKDHRILEFSHPSPLANVRFENCRHFSEINDILSEWGQTLIDWQV